MASGSGGTGPDPGAGAGSGRHRGRFAENAKPLAALLTGTAALLIAIAGMVTLLRSDPAGNPATAVTTTVSVQDTPDAGGVSATTSTPTPTPTTPAPPPTSQ